ncbi:MAG TPA: hypothetical protein VKD72_27950, partial [Gemmataceae bacterium]|nr:hypothetical protein [Gemmataceae bacterium]
MQLALKILWYVLFLLLYFGYLWFTRKMQDRAQRDLVDSKWLLNTVATSVTAVGILLLSIWL